MLIQETTFRKTLSLIIILTTFAEILKLNKHY